MSERPNTRSASAGELPSNVAVSFRDRLNNLETATQEAMQHARETSEEVSLIQKRIMRVHEASKTTVSALAVTNKSLSRVQQELRLVSEESRSSNSLISKVLNKMNSKENKDMCSSGTEQNDDKIENEAPEKSVKDTCSISSRERIKIWQKNMASIKVKTPGDSKFSAAKQTFGRLHEKFPLPMDAEMEMIMLCFDSNLMPTVNRIIRCNPHAISEQLWNKLSEALYNDSQVQAHHAAFIRMTWNETGETIEEYSCRVRGLGENLKVNNQMMKAAFIQGLPRRYQPLVFGDRGSFDSVVAYTSTLVDAGLVKRSEGVWEVTEVKQDNNSSRCASRRVCYACGEVGHTAKDPIRKRYKQKRDPVSSKNNKQDPTAQEVEPKKVEGSRAATTTTDE